MKDNEEYWQRVEARCKALGSDGCTGVPEFYRRCCLGHDLAYRTGRDINYRVVSRQEADALLWQCIQQRSSFRLWSPMAWWRWAGVRIWNRWK